MEKHHSRERAKHTGHNDSRHTGKEDAKAQKTIIVLSIVLFAFAAYNLYVVYASNAAIADKIAAEGTAAAEAARPANLQVTKILAQSCADCFGVAQVENAVRQLNVNVSEKSLDYSSAEARQLISRYGIRKVPAMLITGETEKAGISFWSQIGTAESDGTLVLRYGAPYVDPSSGAEIGKAELINIADKSCGACYNVSVQESVLKDGFGFVFSGIKTYDAKSAEGEKLISLYNITKVPTIIISPDAKYYEMNNFQTVWKQVAGTVEKDGWYVFREMKALSGITYYDLSLNRTVNSTVQ